MTRILDRLRATRMLLSLCFRADPPHALLGLSPTAPVAAGASLLAARHLITALPRDDNTRVVWAAIIFGAAWLGSVVLARIVGNHRLWVGIKMGQELDRRVMTAASGTPEITYFERPEYLDNLEVLRTQRDAIIYVLNRVGAVIDGAGGLVVSLILMLSVDGRLALLLLAGIPALMLNGRAQRRMDATLQSEAERSRRALHLFDVATGVGGAKEIRVFGLEDELLARYRDDWLTSDRHLFAADLRSAAIRSFATLFALGMFALGLVVLVTGVRDGTVSAGDLFIVLGVMIVVVGQMTATGFGLLGLRQTLDIVSRLVDVAGVAERAIAAQDRLDASVPERLERGVRLENVSFRYDGGAPALDEVSIDLPAGSVVAVVGDNGAGKTTLVKLLFGLYQPTSGRILVDDRPLDEIRLDAWRARTSACFQDYIQIELLAREAVGVGDVPRIEDVPAVGAALSRAAATDVVDRLTNGLETQIGTRLEGVDLSGGQWQKLAIARGMMRDLPLVLALDEPTSALDPLAEHELFDRYARLARTVGRQNGAVTVLVSHRFSTVRIADLIVVLKEGKVIEAGSHDELMARKGLYAELFTLQARHYRDDTDASEE